MTINRVIAAAALATAAAFSTAAHAQNTCVIAGDPYDLEADAVGIIYDCIKDQMAAAYAKEGDVVGAAFRDWAVTSTRPAVPGPHGDRFLQTFANDIAADQYLKFEEEGVKMPVGSILAKESFKVNKKGKVVVGPLFVMTKLAAGEAADYGDWFYSAVQPNGKPMKLKQSFCHDCHVGWEDQDALAYPLEEVRIGAE